MLVRGDVGFDFYINFIFDCSKNSTVVSSFIQYLSQSLSNKLVHGPSWLAHLFLVGPAAAAATSTAGWFTVQQ